MSKDKKRNEASQQGSDLSQIGNVDQIREILFGSQTRELNERFEKLESTINANAEEMRRVIEQNKKDFNSRIDNELETLSRKIKNIVTQQQDEFSDVRDSSLKQEKRIQSSLEILEEELSAKNDQLQKQQIENRDILRSEMGTLRDELFDILETKVLELGEAKLSRDDAADIMIEAAMRMKGTQLEQQITQLDG
jgi:hypothetical protein